MNKILEPFTKDAVDLANQPTIEAMETYLHEKLRNPPPDMQEAVTDAVYEYVSKHLIGEYIRRHRNDPIPDCSSSQEQTTGTDNGTPNPEVSYVLEDGVRVKRRDPRFTPVPKTPEEQQAHLEAGMRAIFEFRINQAGRMISIWNAKRETLEVEIYKRQRQVNGIMKNIDFLTALYERLEPGQDAIEAGITNAEMWALFQGATETAE